MSSRRHVSRPDSKAAASTQPSLTAKVELALPSPGLPFTLTFITVDSHCLVHVCVPSWAVSPRQAGPRSISGAQRLPGA